MMKFPALLAVVLRSDLLSRLVSTTTARGMMAPVLSCTTPVTEPEVCCARAGALESSTMASAIPSQAANRFVANENIMVKPSPNPAHFSLLITITN